MRMFWFITNIFWLPHKINYLLFFVSVMSSHSGKKLSDQIDKVVNKIREKNVYYNDVVVEFP